MNIKRILNKIARSSSWYKEVVFQDCEKFWNLKEFNLDLVNLGSNSAKNAFNYRGLNINAANWAMGPQSLQLDLNILQTYYSYLKPSATVLITLCPFSCLVGYDYSYWGDKYYTILHHSQIPCYNIQKRIQMYDIKQNPYKYIPFISALKIFKDIICPGKKESHMTKQQMERDVSRFLDSWKKQFFIKDFDKELSLLNKHSYRESQCILSQLVDFSKRYGFKPVIVLPPVSPYLRRYFSESMIERYINNYIYGAVGQETMFLNYFDSEEFTDFNLYKNSYFLNLQGAKLFTNRVLNDLNIL